MSDRPELPSRIPLLGMGTWGMGGKYERDESNIDESIDALRYGLSLGISHIDVAELYGEGLTEEIVGMAIAETPREKVFLTSKVWKTNLAYDDVLAAAERSLARMKTDYLDLYLIHWPNPDIPLEGTMRALEALYESGKVRAIGVSNFDVALMEEASRYLKKTKIVANQIEYNLAHHEADDEIVPYCRAHDIQVIGYRPFAKGALAAAHDERLERIAAKYGKTANQVALNWILSQGIAAIPKAGSREHLAENAGALGWSLAKEDIEALRLV